MNRAQTNFDDRLQMYWEELKRLYLELYGNEAMFTELRQNLEDFSRARSDALKQRDADKERTPQWYQSADLMGMMLYIDNFAGNMKGVREKLPYLEKANINYLHLMPFLDTVAGRSDGGYAVADFRKVRPDLGTMEDLEDLTAACHEKGINVCMDCVMNHTSEDHEWARRARQGEGAYMSRYFILSGLPKNQVFLNYLRCHDDISWGLDYPTLRRYHPNPRPGFRLAPTRGVIDGTL